MSRDIYLSEIDRDEGQPRQHFDEAKIAELAQSMDTKGLIIPIMVRPTSDARFIIVHGERRYQAAQSLGWDTIRAEVRDVDADEARWLALIENIQRQDLSSIEEAQAYQARLAEGITQAELGKRIGKSQSYIAQKLRLLKLPAPVRSIVACGAITEGHARQLMRIRKMYRTDLMTNLNKDIDTEEILTWETAQMVLNHMRPEDNPPVWIFSTEENPIIMEAVNTFWQSIPEDYKIPQWEITALWWACATVHLPLSVALLSKALTQWEIRFLSGILWVWLHGEVEPVMKSFEDMSYSEHIYHLLWYGYRSDVRHAGARELVSLPSRIIARIAEYNILNEGFALPSSCQKWGFRREEYKELHDIELNRQERDYSER